MGTHEAKQALMTDQQLDRQHDSRTRSKTGCRRERTLRECSGSGFWSRKTLRTWSPRFRRRWPGLPERYARGEGLRRSFFGAKKRSLFRSPLHVWPFAAPKIQRIAESRSSASTLIRLYQKCFGDCRWKTEQRLPQWNVASPEFCPALTPNALRSEKVGWSRRWRRVYR